MTEDDWESGFGRSISVYLNGEGIPDRDSRGQRVADDSFLLCFSAHDEAIDFTVPREEDGASWAVVIDTMSATADPYVVKPGDTIQVGPRAVVALKRVAG